MLQIRLATPEDLPVILGFIDEASEWLRDKKTAQWSKPWPTRAERDARALRGLLACRTWLVLYRQTPVATITFRPEGNTDLWRTGELKVPACYVSRLIVARDYSGQQIGSALVDWAGARARQEFGAQVIRIDVWTTNTALHGYYAKRGFCLLRFCQDEDYPSAALFYKPVAEITDARKTLFWEIPALAPPIREEQARHSPAEHLRDHQLSSHARPGMSDRGHPPRLLAGRRERIHGRRSGRTRAGRAGSAQIRRGGASPRSEARHAVITQRLETQFSPARYFSYLVTIVLARLGNPDRHSGY